VTFTVTVQDNGEDFANPPPDNWGNGKKDVFTITVGGAASLTRSGTLTQGKIMFLTVPAPPA